MMRKTPEELLNAFICIAKNVLYKYCLLQKYILKHDKERAIQGWPCHEGGSLKEK